MTAQCRLQTVDAPTNMNIVTPGVGRRIRKERNIKTNHFRSQPSDIVILRAALHLLYGLLFEIYD